MNYNSPSSIATYLSCPRKWAWKKIAKVKKPPHKSAELGSRCHDDVWEPYLRDGIPPDLSTEEGLIVQPTLIHLPLPGRGVTEGPIALDLPGGRMEGRVDLHVHPNERFPEEAQWYGPIAGVPLVCDHKTTSDFKWAMKPEDLLTDPQGLIYATWAAVTYMPKEFVDLLWNYARTRKPYRAHPVRIRAPLEDLSKGMDLIISVDNEMRDIYNNVTDPLEVDYNASACATYGGCPYIGRCKLTPVERTLGLMSAKLRARLAAKKAGTAPAAAPPPAKEPDAVEAPAAEAPKKRRRRRAAAAETPAPVDVTPEAVAAAAVDLTPVVEAITQLVEVVATVAENQKNIADLLEFFAEEGDG